MFVVRYQTDRGEVRLSGPFACALAADEWRQFLLRSPRVLNAEVVPAIEAVLLVELGVAA